MATAPARLASELNAEVRWRERTDGALEVAAMRNGEVERYVVANDGSFVPAGKLPPPSPLRRGTPIMAAGVLLIAAAVALGVSGLIREEGAVGLGWAGWIVLIVGLGIRNLSRELSSRLKDWNSATDLHGWVPRTSEQLGEVERIADEHDGLAFVRDIGTRTVEVYAMRGGELKKFWVAATGRAEVIERLPFKRQQRVDRALQATTGALFIGVLIVGFGFDNWRFAAALGVFTVLSMISGSVINRGRSLQQHIEKLPNEGQPWIEIRTRVSDPD